MKVCFMALWIPYIDGNCKSDPEDWALCFEGISHLPSELVAIGEIVVANIAPTSFYLILIKIDTTIWNSMLLDFMYIYWKWYILH